MIKNAVKTKPKNNFFKSLRNYFREYCDCTTVHGLKYFTEKERTIFEKIWWFIVFVACVIACALSVYKIYIKWDNNTIIVNPANKETSLFSIPFPTVTICLQSVFGKNKPNYDKLLKDIETFKKSGNVSQTVEFQYMSLICNSPSLNFSQSISANRVKKFTNSFFDIMDKMKPDFNMVDCFYNRFNFRCEKLFNPIIAHDGVCYTFNLLNRSELFRDNVVHYKNFYKAKSKSSDWSLEKGYFEDASLNSYPYRIFSGGAENALSLKILASDDDLDYGCKSFESGYKVYLHTPLNIPDLNQEYFWLPLNQSVVAIVKPVMTQTLDSVKKYKPKTRKCFFQNERQLKYFRHYSSANCKMECRANYTLYLCDCVPFFMPREKTEEICTDTECMDKVDTLMLNDEIWKEVKASELKPSDNIYFLTNYTRELIKSKNKTVHRMDCNCLPSCVELSYEVETTQSVLEVNKWFYSGRNSVKYDKSHLSSLKIFFKSSPFIKTERKEMYGSTDFLANFGGLLGLFSGFSVVSLMEMIYFLTLRILCNRYLFGKWAGRPKSF